LSSHNFNLKKFWPLIQAGAIILSPALLIILQPDLGSVLIYSAFILVLFREGFSATVMMMLAALALLFFTTLLLDKALILLLLVVASLIIYMAAARSFKKGMLNATGPGRNFWSALWGKLPFAPQNSPCSGSDWLLWFQPSWRWQ
jgi:hypothetical protein